LTHGNSIYGGPQGCSGSVHMCLSCPPP
jgi:hypothetical protein